MQSRHRMPEADSRAARALLRVVPGLPPDRSMDRGYSAWTRSRNARARDQAERASPPGSRAAAGRGAARRRAAGRSPSEEMRAATATPRRASSTASSR